GRAAADVEEAGAEVALVLGEAGFGGSERLENGVADENASSVGRGDKVLRRGDRRSDNVDVGFETLADHAHGVPNSLLGIDRKFVGESVEDFAIFGERNVARGIDGPTHVIALNVAGTVAERDATTAIQAAHVAARYTDESGFDRNVSYPFRLFDGTANR